MRLIHTPDGPEIVGEFCEIFNALASGLGFGVPASPIVPQSYNPAYQQQSDQNYYNTVQQMQQYGNALPGQIVPGLTSASNNIQQNPYSGQAQTGANMGAQYGTYTGAPMMAQGAASLQGQANALAPYGQQMLQTGFDPQQNLYNQQWNTTASNSNAINAMNGLAGTPYGASVQNNALNNFNVDWQNQQLQRQQSAASGAGSLLGAAGNAYAGAGNLAAGATGLYQSAAGEPYNVYGGQQQNDISALNALSAGTTGSASLDNSTLQALMSYLGLGQSATGLNQSAAMDSSQEQLTKSQLGGGADLASILGYGTGGGTLGQFTPDYSDIMGHYTSSAGGGANSNGF